jgi:hypothetical protein
MESWYVSSLHICSLSLITLNTTTILFSPFSFSFFLSHPFFSISQPSNTPDTFYLHPSPSPLSPMFDFDLTVCFVSRLLPFPSTKSLRCASTKCHQFIHSRCYTTPTYHLQYDQRNSESHPPQKSSSSRQDESVTDTTDTTTVLAATTCSSSSSSSSSHEMCSNNTMNHVPTLCYRGKRKFFCPTCISIPLLEELTHMEFRDSPHRPRKIVLGNHVEKPRYVLYGIVDSRTSAAMPLSSESNSNDAHRIISKL